MLYTGNLNMIIDFVGDFSFVVLDPGNLIVFYETERTRRRSGTAVPLCAQMQWPRINAQWPRIANVGIQRAGHEYSTVAAN